MNKLCNSCGKLIDIHGRQLPLKSKGYHIPYISILLIPYNNQNIYIQNINKKYSLYEKFIKEGESIEKSLLEMRSKMKIKENSMYDVELFSQYGQSNRGYDYHVISVVYSLYVENMNENENKLQGNMIISSNDIENFHEEDFCKDHLLILHDFIKKIKGKI